MTKQEFIGNLLPFPYAPLSKRCTECGEWKLSAKLQDGWCERCLGERYEPVVEIRPAVLEPQDWTVLGCPIPGVEGHPYTRKEAHRVASVFGGDPFPLDYYREQTKNKTKALGTYPHPGDRPSGRPAKYGKELQNSKGEE